MATMPSSAEGGTPPTHEFCGNENAYAAEFNTATVEICAVGEVTPSSSVPAQISDQPLDPQQHQNESIPVVKATPAPYHI